jgi:hypothetical protein
MARSRRRRSRSIRPLAAAVVVGALVLAGVVALAAQRSPGSTGSTGPTLAASARQSAVGSLSTAVPSRATPSSASPAASAVGGNWSGLRATPGQVSMGDMTLIFSWPGGMLARGFDSPFMKFSADGQSWGAVGDNATFGNEAGLMDGIVWNGRTLVATGQITSARAPTPMVWVSPDGHSWSAADTKGTFDPGTRMAALAANGSAIVGVTADGQVWRSTDARTWTNALLPGSTGTRIVEAIATSKAFAIVGLNGGDGAQVPNKGVTIWSSSDGTAWRAKVLTTQQWAWEKMFILGDRFVAYEGATPEASSLSAGLDAKRGWVSADGYGWTAIAASPAGFDVVGSNGSLLVAQRRMTTAGAPFVLDQSVDGVHWAALPIEVPVKGMMAATAVVPTGVFVSVSPIGAEQFLKAAS